MQLMPKFRVTTTIETTRVVEADNPFAAAVLVGGNVTDVRPARGRVAGATNTATPSKPGKKVAKKRKPMSPEARAKLAQNLVKARAARARNMKAAKKTVKKASARKAVAKKAASKKTTAKKAPAGVKRG
jgi:hypothetical protein